MGQIRVQRRLDALVGVGGCRFRLLAHVQMQNTINCGTQVLVSPDSIKRGAARPEWEGGLYKHMRRVQV